MEPLSEIESGESDVCPFCKRRVELTFHHLIPKKVHRRQFFKKKYSRQELRQGLEVCRLCHDGIHDLFDEMKLAKELRTYEALVEHEAFRRHFSWVAKQRVRS